MDGRAEVRSPPRLIGVAGRCSSEEEKSYVKQAVFLLRYRIKFTSEHPAMPPAAPALPPLE